RAARRAVTLDLATDELLQLAEQAVGARQARAEEAVVRTLGRARGTIEVQPEVESLSEPEHAVKEQRSARPPEQDVEDDRKEGQLDQEHVLDRVDEQLELKNEQVPDQDALRRHRRGAHETLQVQGRRTEPGTLRPGPPAGFNRLP